MVKLKSRKEEISEGLKNGLFNPMKVTVPVLINRVFGNDFHARIHARFEDEDKLAAVLAIYEDRERELERCLAAIRRLSKENENLRQLSFKF